MRVAISLLIALLGAGIQIPAPSEADDVLLQLSKIRLDKKQIHVIRDVTLGRDAASITLNRGVIAFLEPVNGRVTGAVFLGSGEVVAIPPDRIERQQISRFTGTPILNERFQTAVLRFSDGTFEELKKEISQHAPEEVSEEDVAQFDPFDTVLAGRSPALNLRLLADLLEPAGKRFFHAELNGEKSGWFNVVFDLRATEELSVFQIRPFATASVLDVWASFHQRSEARNPEVVAHETKLPVDVLSYEVEGANGLGNNIDAKATLRVKARTDAARVLNFDLGPGFRVSSVLADKDEPLPYYQSPGLNGVWVVLPNPVKAAQELTLRFAYGGDVSAAGPWYPSQRQETIPSFKSSFALPADRSVTVEYSGRKVVPASYHDQWLAEGLTRYLAAMATEPTDSGTQLRQLLNALREEMRPVESAGAISLGQRLASSMSPDAYRVVYAKGVWVIHMLRMMLKQKGPDADAKFLAMLKDFADTFGGRSVSTWDFKRLAEKHADQQLNWFFDQWVFAAGLPSYSVDYKVEGSGNEFTVAGEITQSGVPDGFIMPVPLYADTEYLGNVQVGESEGQFKFRLRAKPERLLIDPQMTILTANPQ